MAKLRLTKTELKKQRDALRRFERYLPMLQLKKQQLQREIDRARRALDQARPSQAKAAAAIDGWIELLGEETGLEKIVTVQGMEVRWDNIAGVDVPHFVKSHVHVEPYDLFALPLWVDEAVARLTDLASATGEVAVLEEQEKRLQRELRVTSQRVNLFEQVKIPEARGNIQRISVMLADQETAAFGWALMAKRKVQAAAAGNNGFS